MIDHLSASQIKTYMDCSLKYKFNYIYNLPKPFRPAGLALGSAVHAALEWLHNKWAEQTEVTLEAVWEIFEADWYAQSLEEILYKDGEAEDDVLNTGRNLLSVYFNSAARDGILQSEYSFKLPIVNLATDETLEVPLVGVIDKIEENDVVVDIKTWSRMISQDDLDGDLQLSAYAYAYWIMHRKNPTLRLDVLMKTKKPRFEQVETFRDEGSHVTFFNLCKEVLNGIKKEVFFPNPSWKCRDCEFRSECWFWQR